MKLKPFRVVLFVAMIACGQSQTTTIDIAAEKTALLEVDRAFNEATAADGIEGWVRFFADDGAMFPAGRPVTRGREAIRALMGPLFETKGFSLTWVPLEAEVSVDGSLGYTHGTFASRFPGEDGEVSVTTGKYLTVWKKQPDGSWKIMADIGNPDPPNAGQADTQ